MHIRVWVYCLANQHMANPPASLVLLMYLLQNSVLLSAKKMVKLMKYPVFIPSV